jgi:hypothetical protein
MLAQAGNLGCPGAEASCLCGNANFGYGIRDCTLESCPENDRNAVLSYGLAYCQASKSYPIVGNGCRLTL